MIKRVLIFVILSCQYLIMYSQTNPGALFAHGADNTLEKWDSNSGKFSNYSYGIGWNLPSELEWKREPGDEQHTIFRATGGPFLVFINAQPVNPNTDLWEIYPQFIKSLEDIDVLAEKETGKITYERTHEKVTLFGKHAIKTTFKEYFKDDRFDKAFEIYAEEYIIIRNGYTLIVAIKVDDDIHNTKDCREYIKKITQGIILTVIK